MNKLKAILAGLCGSLTLNILHRKSRSLNLATASAMVNEPLALDPFEGINENLVGENVDYTVNFLSNIVSNTLLFSTIGFGKQKNFFGRALLLGLVSGASAIRTHNESDLTNQQVEYLKQRNITTVAFYVAGSLVTATLLTILKRKK